jgi:hypothetical protein
LIDAKDPADISLRLATIGAAAPDGLLLSTMFRLRVK